MVSELGYNTLILPRSRRKSLAFFAMDYALCAMFYERGEFYKGNY